MAREKAQTLLDERARHISREMDADLGGVVCGNA
jgi:hypothetical protein